MRPARERKPRQNNKCNPLTLPQGNGWFYVNKSSVEFISAPDAVASGDRTYKIRRYIIEKLLAEMNRKSGRKP